MFTTSKLMQAAMDRTGLSNFGEDSFREPFERMVESINQDSEFTELGRGFNEGLLIETLANRLQVEDWYARHPEIEDEEVVRPVFISGLPRTGSTALGFMLALDPALRSLRVWEAEQPCPPPDINTVQDDPRIAISAARYKAYIDLIPSVLDKLPRDPAGPEECYPILAMGLTGIVQNSWSHIPTYRRWMWRDDFDWHPTYRYHKRVIKLLQWRFPTRQWILRTPMNLLALDALYDSYPDARFIITHRDPVKVVPSMCSIQGDTRAIMLKDAHKVDFGEEVRDEWAIAADRLMAFCEDKNPKLFYHVSQKQIMSDPVAGIANIYDWAGWEFSDDMPKRIRDWISGHPKGDHKTSLDEYGLSADGIKSHFSKYENKYAFLWS